MIMYSCEALSPSMEGFWDKLQGTFRMTPKGSESCDAIVTRLKDLDGTKTKTFDGTVVDIACMENSLATDAVSYINAVYKFMCDNFEDIRRAEVNSKESAKHYSELTTKLNGIRSKLDKNMDRFVALTENEEESTTKGYLKAGRTFRQLGYDKVSLSRLCSQYSEVCEMLSDLKTKEWEIKHFDERQHGAIGNFSSFGTYAKIAVKLHKKLDWFICYVDRKVSKL